MVKAIGIDIGGTKISMVLGNEKGRILANREIPTQTGPQSRKCIDHLNASLREMIASSEVLKRDILGIGVSSKKENR